MKIKQSGVEFQSITLTLETKEDVEAMLDLVGTGDKESVGGRLLANYISDELLSSKFYLGRSES